MHHLCMCVPERRVRDICIGACVSLYGSFLSVLARRLIQFFNGGGMDLLTGNGTCVGSSTYNVFSDGGEL